MIVLNKGLSFSLTNKYPNYIEIQRDIQRFERRLQLYYYFHNKDTENYTELDDVNTKKNHSRKTLHGGLKNSVHIFHILHCIIMLYEY